VLDDSSSSRCRIVLQLQVADIMMPVGCYVCRCVHAFGVPRRDDAGQVARLVPLISNGVFVISERGVDPELEDVLSSAVKFVPRGSTMVRWYCACVSACDVCCRRVVVVSG
jgi:hypothetical protein